MKGPRVRGLTATGTMASETKLATRLLIVTGILALIGVVTVILGLFVLAVVDLVGAVLFFSLWLRRR